MTHSIVMAGLVPAIHVLLTARKSCMPATSAGMTTEMGVPFEGRLVRPGFAPLEGEIVGIGDGAARRRLRLEHLIGDAFALAIGDCLFSIVEPQLHLRAPVELNESEFAASSDKLVATEVLKY